jgi:uncharacterized membrane protein YqhA
MIGRAIAASRYVVLVAVIGGILASMALMIYETVVIVTAIVKVVRDGLILQAVAKTLAVSLIEAVDVFLISIAMYIISLGLYALFVDNRIPLPKWLEVNDIEDLKGNLISVVIAVLAVLFLREAVAWDGSRDLLSLGISLGLVITALTFYLSKKRTPER